MTPSTLAPPGRRAPRRFPGAPAASVSLPSATPADSLSSRPRAPASADADQPGTATTRPGPARVMWHGPDDRLRAVVADHAEAAGAALVDAGATAGTATVHVCAASSLTDLGSSIPPEAVILVVATQSVEETVWRSALELGARAVLTVPAESPQLLALLTESLRPREHARIIGVVGGCGGAGASSSAARLAGAAQRRGTSVLIDADPLGGGLNLLVEAPDEHGASWGDLRGIDSVDGDVLVDGLIRVDGVHLLSSREAGAPDADQLDRVLAATGSVHGTVVVDLAAGLVPSAAYHLTRLLMVLPARDHAVQAAARRLEHWELPTHLGEVVLRGRGPVHPREVEEDLRLPVQGTFRDARPGVVPLLDTRRRGADRLCRRLVAAWEHVS